MQKLFLEVVNMSITASIVLAVVLVLRLLLVRAPRRFSYLLWGIVLFRLLCPVSLPSPFSALDFTEGRATGQGGMEYFSPGDQEEITASVSLISAGSGEDPAWDGIHATVGFGQRMLPVLALVWLAGIAGMAACSILSVARLHRRVGCSLLLRDNIYLADHISTPFVLGLVRPRIYLPSGLTEKEREYILLHEQHHIRRRDYLLKPLAFLALCLHWFNPLVWFAFVLAGRDMEMSCDEEAMREMGQDVRKEYAVLLLQLSTGKRMLAASPLAFGEGNPKKRIKNVMHDRKPAAFAAVAAVIICIVAAGCLMTNPADSPPLESEEDEPQEREAAVFRARVLESGSGSLLVERVEGSLELSSADRIRVPIPHSAPSPEPRVGDLVEISYDGAIMETDPAQLGEVYEITVIQGPEPAGETDMEEAVLAAIMEHNAEEDTGDVDFICCSFVKLGEAPGAEGEQEAEAPEAEGEQEAEAGAGEERVIYYGWALYRKYRISEEEIQVAGGSHLPVALTFERRGDTYILAEYWEPRGGGDFQEDIHEKFPQKLWEDGVDSQKFILMQEQACHAQAVSHAGLDTDAIISGLLQAICSSPEVASDPGSYLNTNHLEYRELLFYGEYTVRYCIKRFEEGNETGLEGHVMARACEEILELKGKLPVEVEPASTGQEWYETLKAHAGNVLEPYLRQEE